MQKFFDAIACAQGEFSCTDDDLNEWFDEKTAGFFKKSGVFVRQEAATSIDCPGCGRHAVFPVFSGVKKDIRSYLVTCDDPAIGTFDIQGDLFRYKVDLQKFAHIITDDLGLSGGTREKVSGQLFELGIKKYDQGNVRCFLVLTVIERHKQFLTESAKSAPTVVFCPRPATVFPADQFLTLNIIELLSISGRNLQVDQNVLDQAVRSLFGVNYYENGILYAHGESLASIIPGTKLDIFLKYLTAPGHSDKPVANVDILNHYNKIKGSTITGADQWCYQALSELREKCGEKAHLVDTIIHKGGREKAGNSLIFRSKD